MFTNLNIQYIQFDCFSSPSSYSYFYLYYHFMLLYTQSQLLNFLFYTALNVQLRRRLFNLCTILMFNHRESELKLTQQTQITTLHEFTENSLIVLYFDQIDPSKYKNITSAFKTTIKEQGLKGFTRGWSPTLIGYSAQGAFKYGLYEYAKKYYSDIVGPENAAKYKTLIYLAGSASAEIVADVALCPMEAVKVRVQTQPGFARGLSDGLPKIIRSEGVRGLFKGLVPLWGRQIPCKSLYSYTKDNLVQNLFNNLETIFINYFL